MTSAIATPSADGAIAGLVAAFERDGYVHLQGVYTAGQVAEFNGMRDQAVADWCFVTGTTVVPEAVGDILERFPRQGLQAVANPLLLRLAEALMGPTVQLDSAVLVGAPSVDPAHRDEPVAWHRDRFGFFPYGVYTRPLSIILIAYLQEMADDVGPLRVVPASHQEPVAVELDRRQLRHPCEVKLRTRPGDIVALHHNLLHSGTHNVSGTERRFFGFTYADTSRRQQDNLAGSNCQALIQTARRTNDRRTLRLLGADPLIDPRQNTGFVQPHTAYWPSWHDDDNDHAAEAAHIRQQVERARAAVR